MPHSSFRLIGLLAISAPALTRAHGLPGGVQIGGVTYPYAAEVDRDHGPVGGLSAPVDPQSPWRPVRTQQGWDQPVRLSQYTAGLDYGICGQGGNKEKAGQTVAIEGGEQLIVKHQWRAGHLGTIHAYMADCKGSCDSYMPQAGAKDWFKTEYLGIDATGPPVPTIQDFPGYPTADYYDKSDPTGAKYLDITYPVTIPKLKPGEYLLRTELDFFNTDDYQTYPRCLQLKVTGGGEATPRDSELVAFPDIYQGWTESFGWNSWTPEAWKPNGGANVTAGGHCRGQGCSSGEMRGAYTAVTMDSKTDPSNIPASGGPGTATGGGPSTGGGYTGGGGTTALPSAPSHTALTPTTTQSGIAIPPVSDIPPAVPSIVPATSTGEICSTADFGHYKCLASGSTFKLQICGYIVSESKTLNWVDLPGDYAICDASGPTPVYSLKTRKRRLLEQ